MNVYLFSFAKRENSTLKPVLNTGTLFNNVQLKEETSVTAPSLIFNPNSSGMPTPFTPSLFTYCYIQNFNRYYFIRDWQYINGLWVCFLKCDVLASFKTEIGALSAYVTRSASNYDGDIIDTHYPAKAIVNWSNDPVSMKLSQTGFYIIGTISKSAAATDGAISYYILTETQMSRLMEYLLSDGFITANGLGNLSDIPRDLVKSYFNPFEYIASCRFFPLNWSDAIATAQIVSDIDIGWWTLPVSGYKMASGLFLDIQTDAITVSAHPQAATRGPFLNHNPFTERILIHPLLGIIPMDANKMDAGDSIQIHTRVDCTTGEALTYIGNATKNVTMFSQGYKMAIDIQIAQISQQTIQMAKSAVNTVGNIVENAMLQNWTGLIKGGLNDIADFVQTTQPILSTGGSNGNRSVYHIPVYFVSYFRLLVDEDRTDKGRPLCKVKTLNTLSGYTLCSAAHANFSCFADEKTEIENYLNTGFFYE